QTAKAAQPVNAASSAGPEKTATPEPVKSAPPKEEPKAESDEGTAMEMERYLALAEKGNHYQLLGLSSDASSSDVKKGFYALARKFHPDRHMNRPEWVKPLQQLMGAITV